MIPCRFNLSGLTFSGTVLELDLPVLPEVDKVFYFHDNTDTKMKFPSGEYKVGKITLCINKEQGESKQVQRGVTLRKIGEQTTYFYLIDAELSKQDDEGKEGRTK